MAAGFSEELNGNQEEYLWKLWKNGNYFWFTGFLIYYFSDAQTLVPLIKKWILPNTKIISDSWKAYDTLGKEGYEHLRVNHSISFVNQENPEIHTNRIESTWRHAKESFSTHGRVKVHVPGNLARYMFLKAAKAKDTDPTEEFLRMAAYIYSEKYVAKSSSESCTSEPNMDEENLEDDELDVEDIVVFDE